MADCTACVLRIGILIYPLPELWVKAPTRTLIFLQLPLTWLVGIWDGLSGQKSLGFYKSIWGKGLEQLGCTCRFGVMNTGWQRFQEIPTKKKRHILAKAKNCDTCCLFPISRPGLSLSTGEAWTFSTLSQISCSEKLHTLTANLFYKLHWYRVLKTWPWIVKENKYQLWCITLIYINISSFHELGRSHSYTHTHTHTHTHTFIYVYICLYTTYALIYTHVHVCVSFYTYL
jgi:hypothetical protein